MNLFHKSSWQKRDPTTIPTKPQCLLELCRTEDELQCLQSSSSCLYLGTLSYWRDARAGGTLLSWGSLWLCGYLDACKGVNRHSRDLCAGSNWCLISIKHHVFVVFLSGRIKICVLRSRANCVDCYVVFEWKLSTIFGRWGESYLLFRQGQLTKCCLSCERG